MRKRSCGSVRIFYPEFDRDAVVKIIEEDLPKVLEKLPLVLVVLFGSYAKGNFTALSDVDLLVVYEDPPREDAYKIVKKCIKVKGLEPHVYSSSEYEQVRDVVKEMIRDGVVIFRREDV